MGVELLKIGTKMRKGVMFTVKPVYNHPFIVMLLSVLIYMYRSSPLMFSLLVSASPVLVSTAVLLGTLLFFGQPNLPELEIEEKKGHDTMCLTTELSKDSVSVVKNEEENERCFGERFGEERRDEERPSVGSGLSESEMCREGSVDVNVPLSKERSLENESEKGEISEEKMEKRKTEWNDERLRDVESDNEKSEADYFDSKRVNMDSLEFSTWKQVGQREDEEEEEEDDGSDSRSDRAESSSPDASMADIIPMLDELHPLLDEDAGQPVQISRGGTNAPSEQSSPSSISSIESVETENADGSEVADDDVDNEGDKEDQMKAAIRWTEEDQKNVMDLGSSEIERNRRLENAIMRMRSRKNLSMVPEINLIDLESSDFPIHVAPINTTRQNPFELPHDSYANLGPPPVPGSAPSVLLPRRNPFDIPYDAAEEKPNQMGDGFDAGPSVFAPNRQDLKWRPYFVPERMVLEEPSYSALQRESSEMSESKVSSVPETESVSSVDDLEDRKLEEEDDPQEVIEEGLLGDQDQVSKRGSSEEDESQSSEGEECLEVGSVEKRGSEINDQVEDHYGEGCSSASSLSEVGEIVLTEIDDLNLSISDDISNGESIEPDISSQSSDRSITSSLVDDVPHKDHVFDSSPPAASNVPPHDSRNSDLSGVNEKSDENFADQQTHGDKNEGELEEEKRLPSSKRGSPTPVEGQLEVEHSVHKGETVQSLNSDDDYHGASERISTPSAGGSTAHFYGSAMHESDFENLQEVQVPNTPVDSQKLRSIHNIHIPALHVLDHHAPPNIKSSSIPDSVSEEDVFHVDTQTVLEAAVDEIKESCAGFDSIGQKHVDSAEVRSFEENKIQHEMRLENTRNEIATGVREAKTLEDVHSDIERGNSVKSSSSRRLSTPF